MNVRTLRVALGRAFGHLEGKFTGTTDPVRAFHSNHYLRHNARRLEHLASLRIRVAELSVLEVGAGAGDHTHYYLDRGCRVTVTEARTENLEYLKKRYPACCVQHLDLDRPAPVDGSPFDVVHCYGLLYHLQSPGAALAYLASNTMKYLFLETCVSFGQEAEVNNVSERRSDLTQACSGTGCRPTRNWVFGRLQELFEFVYVPLSQPNHEEFPVDWTKPERHVAPLQRAIFIGSREPIENGSLMRGLPDLQHRHD